MRGPGIPRGRSIDRAHVFDVAPTILARLGVEAPAHLTGRRLVETTIA
jgi:arylsulfatase A-like enzyme